MTTRAIAHAYYDAHEKTGIQPVVKIMIPLVATVSEYLQQVHIIDREMHAAYLARRHTLRFAKEHFESRLAKEREYELDYHPFKVGCMLETPRSCLIAKNLIDIEDVGEENFPLRASFFSLGTNDLTQMTFGYSRDDSSFFQAYEREKVALVDPFEILDWDGVGKLIKIALNEITTEEEEKEEETDDETGKPKSLRRLRLRRLAEVSACGEHAGNPKSIEFFVRNKIDVVSCSAFRVLGARLAVAKARIQMEEDEESRE
jgi:pyruvate,orthophosphate dikinase